MVVLYFLFLKNFFPVIRIVFVIRGKMTKKHDYLGIENRVSKRREVGRGRVWTLRMESE